MVSCLSSTSEYTTLMYGKTCNISRTPNPRTLSLSLCNLLKPDVKWRIKMLLEQHQQAMLQLHLSDQKYYCLIRFDLCYRFKCNYVNETMYMNQWLCVSGLKLQFVGWDNNPRAILNHSLMFNAKINQPSHHTAAKYMRIDEIAAHLVLVGPECTSGCIALTTGKSYTRGIM